jgi:hypothetical protein
MTVLNLAQNGLLTQSGRTPRSDALRDRAIACLIPLGQSPQANTWVKLLELPHPWSYDEALLLCQHSEDEWVAWIPDYGEAVLNAAHFC